MNERIRREKYKGKEILLCDFTKLMGHQFIEFLNLCFEEIQKNQDQLIIFDVEKATIVGDALKEAKEFAKKIHPFRKKSAFLGIIGPKKILLESILMFSGSSKYTKTFGDKELAMDWLVQ